MKGFFPSSRVQQERPDAGLMPKCGACRLFRSCQAPKMEPYGKGQRRVLVIGEAPGETEDERGRPFVGKAGQFLREVLDGLDINLDKDALTTNACICRPPKNRTPDEKQIGYCRPNLLRTIAMFRPRVIVTLGRSALAGILGAGYWLDIGPLERWTGWRIPLSDYWICPTFHPSYLLRTNSPVLDRMFTQHLAMAFGIQNYPPRQPDFEQLIELVYDEQDIADRIKDLHAQGGWVAVDYETNCIKPDYEQSYIASCAMSNGKQTISFPFVGKAAEATGKLLRSDRTRKIASNLKFEEQWTRKKFGHGVNNWGWDTMLASHCLDNRPGICSLKFQAFVRLGVPVYNEKISPYLDPGRGRYNRVREIDTSNLLFYGGMDALLEYRLAMRQRRDLDYED